jgi:predicted transcriptional regulator of viral defense system
MLDALPSAFTLGDARQAGLRKDEVYGLLSDGAIERLGRGVFARTDSLDPSLAGLAAATARQPAATLCLTSALSLHGLSDAIPAQADVALPRGARHPAGLEHIAWHSFDTATFQIGREPMAGEPGLFAYSPERTIIDSFRLAHREGSDVAAEALKRWLRGKGHYPAKLLELAKAFPKARPSLRTALEVLA